MVKLGFQSAFCRGAGGRVGNQRRRLEAGRQEVIRGQDLGPGFFPLD